MTDQDRIEQLTHALELINRDMHNPSPRPCATCKEITKILGHLFGCMKYYREA